MAESTTGAPQLDAPKFDEKHIESHPTEKAPARKVEDEEEEDEDIDALIEDLESQDGHGEIDDEEDNTPGAGRVVPEDMLQTDTRVGLTEAEVTARRRKYGLNQMKYECYIVAQLSTARRRCNGWR
jgi:H+-transporting ATPase